MLWTDDAHLTFISNVGDGNDDSQCEKIGRYYSPSAPLKALSARLSCTEGYNIKVDIIKLNTKVIYATLLPLKKIKFGISKSDKIVLTMQIVHDND